MWQYASWDKKKLYINCGEIYIWKKEKKVFKKITKTKVLQNTNCDKTFDTILKKKEKKKKVGKNWFFKKNLLSLNTNLKLGRETKCSETLVVTNHHFFQNTNCDKTKMSTKHKQHKIMITMTNHTMS